MLITGGAGFIGANFVLHRLAHHADERLVVLDALTYAGNLASLTKAKGHPSYRFIHGDIRDTALVERILREESIDTVVHFAAESHVDRSIEGPDAFIETNVLGTHSMLKAARKVWLEQGAGQAQFRSYRFHHVSTDEVYGSLGPTDAAFHERTPYAPNSPYSASKAASDHLVRAYHHTYGLPVTISNCSNNYGPYHFPEKLIPLMIVNILHGKPLPIYGDGRNVRDWLYVEDHCRGIDLILDRGREGETYNIGGRAECENLQLVRLLCEHADRELVARPDLLSSFPASPVCKGGNAASLIQFVTDRPGHDRRYAINCGKIERELGFQPTVSLSEGLRRTVTWYLANTPWWQNVMDGRYQDWISTQYHKR
jgi:dTDP-glucose 4,6-dehydratase